MSRFHVQQLERLDPGSNADLYALRDAIVCHRSAEVRATALLRLDACAAAALTTYLRDSTHDRAARVREAAFVALARSKDPGAVERALEVCSLERAFRVRRMAVVYAARTSGSQARRVLEVAATDPFWRVRTAAHRAATTLGLALEAEYADAAAPLTGKAALDDDDPAVVTARLLRSDDVDASALVGLLAHPHQPLRRLAIRRISSRADVALLRKVLAHLADDRIPYAPAAAEATLARCPGAAEALATNLTSGAHELAPGELAWAIRQAVPAPRWSQLEAWCHHSDVRVRRAAVTRLPEAGPSRTALFGAMAALLGDSDHETRTRAAAWLHASRARDARDLLRRLAPKDQPTAVRVLLVELAAEAGDEAGLRELGTDPHASVRAWALWALVTRNCLNHSEKAALFEDPDPWVRAAVMDDTHATLGARDPSPVVRRTALERLTGTVDLVSWAASHALDESEPDLRALAVRVLTGATDPRALRALLRFSRDCDPGVRSAALEPLSGRAPAVARLLAESALEPGERIAAHTLLREANLRAPAFDPDPNVQAHIQLLDATFAGGAVLAATEKLAAPRARPAEARQLGRTGILVHPFGISGARGLGFDDFALALDRGVNLFFWEPTHRELTRFLRSRRGQHAVVVTGTYHADRESIEVDLERALKTLGRSRIDVFLAFWTRSPARLAEVAPTLGSLSARGLVRAAGISTHDRALAREAADRELEVVMVRHNAAHRGAETEVFPHCAARETGVLTFSNLCYGRMLHQTPADLAAPVDAADCYRYSLSQPGVVACISAPRRRSELTANLEVVDRPTLSPERQHELRQHGDHVYARSKAWNATVRGARPACGTDTRESLDDWLESPDSLSPDL